MSSNQESGHAKNVANFEDLISFCVGYGTTYNPSKNSIKVTALNTLLTSTRASLVTVNATATAYNNAVNTRVIAFANIKKLSTRLLSALVACGATTETVADAKTVNRKIQGSRAHLVPTVPVGTPPAGGGTPDPTVTVNTISVSQQSYDSLIEHLSRMATLLSAEPLYLPNENELKATTVTTLVANLRAANTAVINATTTVSNARIARNTALYNPTTGLCEVAKEVKMYVKSVFGATSPQYKQISGIVFRSVS